VARGRVGRAGGGTHRTSSRSRPSDGALTKVVLPAQGERLNPLPSARPSSLTLSCWKSRAQCFRRQIGERMQNIRWYPIAAGACASLVPVLQRHRIGCGARTRFSEEKKKEGHPGCHRPRERVRGRRAAEVT
jgi:hypothetical protein